MTKRIGILFIYFSFLFTGIGFGQSDTTEIILFHTNDMHAKIDNYSKLAYIVKECKQSHPNVFLISAGDLFTGNPIVDQNDNKGLPMIELMNLVDYDLSCLGNHEFDYGQNQLSSLMIKSSFPFICANINTSGSDMKPMNPYQKLYTKDGISLGFVGLIQIEDNHLPATNPNNLNGISFSNPLKTVKKYVSYKDSSDIFIALTHIGFDQDIILATKYPFFDLIIGGHTHTKLDKGEFRGNTLIVQADSHMDYLGKITLIVVNHKLVSKEETLIDLRSYPNMDSEVSEFIRRYNQNDYFKEVIGSATEEISGKDELGSLMTDAMQDTLKTDISFVNEGGIRLKFLPKGDISLKEIYQLSPFGNTYVILKLTTKEIKQLIEYTYQYENENDLQVSGILIDLYVNEQNALKRIELKDVNGEKLKSGTYTVAVNNFMASAYKLKFLKKGIDSGIVDAQTTINYIKKKKTVSYKGVKRINIIKENQ
jgi:5'-nucleotidase / UDP-sugar diphosphatase